MKSPPRNRIRRGFSLAEMVVVMLLLSITMMVTAVLFNGSMALGRAAATADRRPAWRRDAADQFRHDVSRAQSASIADTALTLQLAGGRRIRYDFAENQIVRTEMAPGQADSTNPLGTGLKLSTVTFAQTEGPRPLVTMTVHEPRLRGPDRVHRFAAARGGDLR